MKNKSARVVRHGEGRALRAFGDEIVIHLDGQDTHGTLTMWTDTLPLGGGPSPHYHLNEDKAFRVLEGRVAFLVNGAWHEAGPGLTCHGPSRLASSTEFISCNKPAVLGGAITFL